MIVVYFLGRTGNQLFQYACARQLMFERGDYEKFAFTFENVRQDGGNILNSNNKHEYDNMLQHFNIRNYVSFNDVRLMRYCSIKQKAFYILKKLHAYFAPHMTVLQRKIDIILGKQGVILYDFDKKTFTTPSSQNVILYGHFEDPIYFPDIQSELKDAFTPIHPPLKQNKELYKIIQECNSVCVHVRRGDFLDPIHKRNYYVCDESYYHRAIAEIKKKVEHPVFIFFSNDIDWVKKNISVDSPCYFEPVDNPIWETLRMMYSCKHYIISNSTFSWWGQYLSRNPNKIIVSPSHRYANAEWNKKDKSHIISDNFIKIKVRENS